jgi:hypothetical protein
MNERPLISAENYQMARDTAREHGITPQGFIYIPLCNREAREESLRGIKVPSRQWLIGPFSEPEMAMLLMDPKD